MVNAENYLISLERIQQSTATGNLLLEEMLF